MYMLRVFDAATSSAVPISVMRLRQRAISPGASHSPPRKVITTSPVMRGLASWTMLRNQARPARPGAVATSARSTTRTCVASSAVATARCDSTVARSRKLVTACRPSAICTHTSTGAAIASVRSPGRAHARRRVTIDDMKTSNATATPVSRWSGCMRTVGCASGHSDPRQSGTSVQASAAPEWRTRPPSTIWK